MTNPSDLAEEQREDLIDAVYETLSDTCDMDVSFTQYARAVVDMLEQRGLLRSLNAKPADMEKLAAWMMLNGFATGHGDTMDDLLGELGAQIKELRVSAHRFAQMEASMRYWIKQHARLSDGLIAIHEASPDVPADVLRGIAYDIVLNCIDPETARFQITRRAGIVCGGGDVA